MPEGGDEVVRLAAQLHTRRMRDADVPHVLDLINADAIPGQPAVTRAMLRDAAQGRSQVDAGWWDELAEVVVEVLADGQDVPVGVVSYARRPRDGAGLLLWLHGGEDEQIIASLVDRALTELAGSKVIEAFAFASALTMGLEALPVRHRPVTARVLRSRGFVASDLWRYMHRRLPATELPVADGVQVDVDERGHRKLTVPNSGAEADVSVPTRGIGVLWWISVPPEDRGRGLGAALLGSALQVLTGEGAAEVILYVDDDAPADDPERGRGAANRLYERAGFTEVDRLHSFRLDR